MNNKLISYKLYNISDLSNWLLSNVNNGLSEKIISKKRALALINNPHAKANDVALSVVFDSDKVVGYTAVFPERFVKPQLEERYFWGTTQWLEPEYRGKGISAKMMLNIKEAVNNLYLGLDSSVASTKLDKKQGSSITYYTRYFILLKPNKKNIKTKIKEFYINNKNRRALKKIQHNSYENEYVCCIDDDLYNFICKHSTCDVFLRTQEILNWQIQYPFSQAVGKDIHIKKEKCQFGTNVDSSCVIPIKVIKDKLIVGFYILNIINGNSIVRYLYYSPENRNEVYASLINKSFSMDIVKFTTFDKDLYKFLVTLGIKSLNSSFNTEKISLTAPADFKVDDNARIQGGDGDLCF